MKTIKYTLIVISVIFVSSLVLWVLFRVPNEKTPKKLEGVPKEAVWRGSIDEGFWFLLKDIDTVNRRFRFKIFNDYKGELVLDAYFEVEEECNEIPLNKNIIEKIRYFEFEKIIIDSCSLKVIYPAFGGTFWELEKDSKPVKE